MEQDDKEQAAHNVRQAGNEHFGGEGDLEAVDEYMRSQGYLAAKDLLKKAKRPGAAGKAGRLR